jgi:uncharacterized protein (TIGR02147 family)
VRIVKKPLIQDYENYRDYLHDWYEWMKESNPQFSYRTFSKWVGFKSPNQLQLIIQGKRNITRQTLGLFTKILKLKRREARYFEILVNMNQASTPESKANYLKDLSDYFKKQGDELKHNQYEYLIKWYYAVLRELVTTKGLKFERHALANRIGHGVTPRQVDEALDKLVALELLVKDEKGNFKQSQAVVTTGAETKEAASYFYHEQMLKLALAALKKQMPDERNFSAITLACRKDDVSEIAQILNDCRRQVLSYLENREAHEDEEVYQLNLQFFRVTKKR